MMQLFSIAGSFLAAYIWILLLTAIPLIYLIGRRNFDYWAKRGIAGPAPLLFIGTFFSFSKPIPLLYREHVEKYGKFFGGFRLNRPTLYISDPEVIKRIMVKDFHLFRNRAFQPPKRAKLQAMNLVNARDEQWKRIRSILSPMFTSAKLRKLEPQMRACTKSMLDSFERYTNQVGPSGVAELVAHDTMGNFTMDVIAKCAFATDTNAHEEPNNRFVVSARQIMSFNPGRFVLQLVVPDFIIHLLSKIKFPFTFSEGGEFFENLAKHLITERKREKGLKHEDMLQLMVNAEFSETDVATSYGDKEDQLEAHHVNAGTEELESEKKLLQTIVGSKKLTEEEIVAQAIVFFLAGYDTTASTLSTCLFELAINPAIQDRLYREVQEAKEKDPELTYQTVQNLPYLDAVISEALRKYPPVIQLGREYGGHSNYHIPEARHTLEPGDIVTFPIVAIHHMPEYYPESDKFNPDRFLPENRHQIIPYTYLPFGGGPRACIGMRFALTEAKLGLAQIVDRFEIVRTDKTSDTLRIKIGFPLLKTEPIHIGVKKR